MPLAEALLALMDPDRDDAVSFPGFLQVGGCVWVCGVVCGVCVVWGGGGGGGGGGGARGNLKPSQADTGSFLAGGFPVMAPAHPPVQAYDEFLARTMADVQPPSKRRRTDSRLG